MHYEEARVRPCLWHEHLRPLRVEILRLRPDYIQPQNEVGYCDGLRGRDS